MPDCSGKGEWETSAFVPAQQYLSSVARVIEQVPAAIVDEIVVALAMAYDENRAVFVYGNGGSAALASHAACDLGKGTACDGLRRFRVMSLTDNLPLITAWANDFGYEYVFAEQLRNLAQPNDVCVAISASGNSPNVLNALRVGRDAGAFNIGITGFNGGKLKHLCDICLVVPSENMQFIEDAHLCIMHCMFTAVRSHIQRSHPVSMVACTARR